MANKHPELEITIPDIKRLEQFVRSRRKLTQLKNTKSVTPEKWRRWIHEDHKN